MTLFSGPYALLARFVTLGLVVLSIFGYGWFKGHSSAQTAFDEYRGKVEALGEAQAKRTAEIIKVQNARKDASDASYKIQLAALNADIGELRNRRTSDLPATPTGSRCPDGWACFDRAELQSALQRFDGEVSGIVAEGDQVKLRLKLAAEWATLPGYQGNK